MAVQDNFSFILCVLTSVSLFIGFGTVIRLLNGRSVALSRLKSLSLLLHLSSLSPRSEVHFLLYLHLERRIPIVVLRAFFQFELDCRIFVSSQLSTREKIGLAKGAIIKPCMVCIVSNYKALQILTRCGFCPEACWTSV